MHFKKDAKQMVFDLIIFTSGRSYGRNSTVSKLLNRDIISHYTATKPMKIVAELSNSLV